MTHLPLTTADVIALSTVVDAASQSAKVRFMRDAHSGDILDGTARHIVTSADDWGFTRTGQDIRDAHLRITLTSGLDIAPSVAEVVEMIQGGRFYIVRD